MVSAVKTFDYIISAFISSILQHILFDSLFHWIVPVCYYRWGMTCNSSFFAFASVLLHFCTSCEKLAGDEMFFNIFKKMTIDEGALACLECSQRQWKIIISSVAYEYSCIKVVLKKNAFFPTWAQFHQHSLSSFYAHRSQVHKKRQSSQLCHLALLGPTSVKAVHRTLMKLTPGINFINSLVPSANVPL